MSLLIAAAALLSFKTEATEKDRVLLVVNRASSESRQIANYYISRRGLNPNQIIEIDVSTSENIGWDEYEHYVRRPIADAIERRTLPVDFLITTKGIPLKVGVMDSRDNTQGFSVDSCLVAMNLNRPRISDATDSDQLRQARNPFFGSSAPFHSAKHQMVLVTRIDGEDLEQCFRLIENGVSATPKVGPFFFDFDDAKETPGYREIQASMDRAVTDLKTKQFVVTEDRTSDFADPGEPLMGYVSWGSNDMNYRRATMLKLKFYPGAIADTYVNTSARTMTPWSSGQSQITDMIRLGVTGVKGYVSEPLNVGLSAPNVLFSRYVSGFNLAESFWSATPLLPWKDVVIGDPLCRPYSQSTARNQGE